MKKLFIVSFFVLSLLGPVAAHASEIYGKIFYKGSPLKNASITVKDKKSTTNDLGFYSVTGIDAGSYTLEIKLPDGTSKQEKVDVFPQPTEKNLKLE